MTSVIATRTNVSLSRYVYKVSVEIDIKLTPVSTGIPQKKLIALRKRIFAFKGKVDIECSRIFITEHCIVLGKE